MNSEEKKIVVVKKKKGGHDHPHGGAWKVAYADFVTAMMAFFLVMWIMGMDQGVRDLVEGYFTNPIGFKRAFSGGSNPTSTGLDPTRLDLRRTVILSREQQRQRFQQVAEEIREKVKEAGLLRGMEAAVEVVVTDQGLRIELMETGQGEFFFDKASAQLKPAMSAVLALIAPELQGLPNPVVVEGHTDALPFGGTTYSNWELSVDRANAARRALLDGGMAAEKILEVRGHADREPKIREDPLDPRNRRISLLLPFQEGIVVEEYLPAASPPGPMGGGPVTSVLPPRKGRTP